MAAAKKPYVYTKGFDPSKPGQQVIFVSSRAAQVAIDAFEAEVDKAEKFGRRMTGGAHFALNNYSLSGSTMYMWYQTVKSASPPRAATAAEAAAPAVDSKQSGLTKRNVPMPPTSKPLYVYVSPNDCY